MHDRNAQTFLPHSTHRQPSNVLHSTEQAPSGAELVLVRALPGSGKSTMARVLAMVGYEHYEADMFFIRSGVYCYDKNHVRAAHDWCKHQTREALAMGHHVVVSNTFTRLSEMEDYLAMARNVRILEANGLWQNEHGVPQETLAAMARRWEPTPVLP